MRLDGPTRRWVEAAAGDGTQVVRSRRLHGGVASIVQEITLDRAGARHRLVLRRTPDRPDVAAQDPAREVAAEARALRTLSGRALSPRLVAADPEGAHCGVAALLMTRCAGRPDVAPSDPDRWVRAMAEAVRTVQGAAIDGAHLDDFRPWWPDQAVPPTWVRRPGTWRAVRAELADRLPKGGPVGTVHRDLHPGNILLRRHRLSGVVDWVHACRGPVEVDVSRCRVEVALLAGIDVADALLAQLGDLVPDYDRHWDALVAWELAPWVEDLRAFHDLGATVTVDGMRHTLDTLVEAAATRRPAPSAVRPLRTPRHQSRDVI